MRCLLVLLTYGWKRDIEPNLAKQLLILLTLLLEDPESPVELRNKAFECLQALFGCLQYAPSGPSSLVETDSFPALGHAATVILHGLTTDSALWALGALEAMWLCIKDRQALSTFLPATISTLTKLLSKKLESRKKVIVKALTVYQHVLFALLSDIQTRSIRNENADTSDDTASKDPPKLTKSWLRATSSQIKLALSNIIRLRNHESEEVLNALANFCLATLDECRETLQDSASMLLETAMALTSRLDANAPQHSQLAALTLINADLGNLVKTVSYNWITSLPTVMQSNDDSKKKAMLGQIAGYQSLLQTLAPGSEFLQEALTVSLRDTVTHLMASLNSPHVQVTALDINSQALVSFSHDFDETRHFRSMILSRESQTDTLRQFSICLKAISSGPHQIQLATSMLEHAQLALGETATSAYWLAQQMSIHTSQVDEGLGELIHKEIVLSDESRSFQNEIYTYAVSVLTEDDTRYADWRMQAISLEVVADAAKRMGMAFKQELIDVLYPVTHLLGSASQNLREHAIICLNLIAHYCGYENTKELIIQNVDYMVNAISLRLDTFDISPQAPQVLVMMIRLSGPSLIPYLDDVVGSIFAALDNFHGYQLLVQNLFSVLSEIVSVGSTSGQLLLDAQPAQDHRKQSPEPISIESLTASIRKQQERKEDYQRQFVPSESFPKEPWTSARKLLDESQGDTTHEEEPPNDDLVWKPTKTHELMHRITQLCQHYLTHASPNLRHDLLTLITRSISSLSSTSDDFLPLINDIYPVLIPRLYDQEFFVVMAACDALGTICIRAGDFMASRIETEWPTLLSWARRCRHAMRDERRGKIAGSRSDRGVYAQAHRVWVVVVELFCRIVECVRIRPHILDDVLELLADELIAAREASRATGLAARIRKVLAAVDADKLWFELYRRGGLALEEEQGLVKPESWRGMEFRGFDRLRQVT